MSPSPSPVVANWELVVRLRERRLERRLSVMEFARRLNFTHNYWSQIENERKVVSAGTLEKIFDVLALDDTDRGLLRQLREQAKENGWWSEYNDLFDEAIQRFYGLEHGAQRISEHETLLIPGLLQTKDYARAVMELVRNVRLGRGRATRRGPSPQAGATSWRGPAPPDGDLQRSRTPARNWRNHRASRANSTIC